MVRVEDLLYACLEAGSAREQQLEELCRSHPDHADELRRMVAELSALGFLRAEHAGAGESGPAVPARVGSYRIEELIGRGGMGLVFRARQANLGDRPVAVKMIRPDLVADPRAEARFLREALLASKLDHPCLCPVLDFGRDQGMPYLVMPLVDGGSLAQHIAAARERRAAGDTSGLRLSSTATTMTAPPWARIVEMVEKLARGLHRAHEAGLVHRDVKPGNVMIRPDGEPVLLDFGLARASDDGSPQLTLSHEVLGTPAYMAPEQIEPRGRGADARTDVFALGVLLYECLALRLPHEGSTREQLVRRILEDPPSDVRRHGPAVPRDLAVVLQVALEKAPDRRYASALLLAEDLQRVRTRMPIAARRPGAGVRAGRWVARNPWPTTAGAVLLAGLVATLGLLVHVQAQATRSRALALVGSSQAAATVDQSLSLHLALAAVDAASELTETRDQLHRATRNMHEVAILGGFVGDLVTVGFCRDGTRSFAVGNNGVLVLGDRDGRELTRRALGAAVELALPVEIAGSPALVAACGDGRIRLWRPGSEPEVTIIGPALEPSPGHLLFGERGAVAPDGQRVLLGTRRGRVLVLSIPEGKLLRDIPMQVGGKPVSFVCGAFAGDDGLVLAGGGCWIQYWRDGDQPARTFRHPAFEQQQGESISRIVVDRSGERAVAMIAGRPSLLACSLTDDKSKLLDAQPLGLRELVVAPDGATFASGANDGTVAIWRFGEQQPNRLLLGHKANVTALAFSPDGELIVSGAEDRTVRLWDLAGHAVATLPGHRARINAVAIDTAGKLILSGSADSTVRLWRVAEGLPAAVHPQRAPQSFGRFCSGREPGMLRIGDTMTGQVWIADWRTGEVKALAARTNDRSFLHIDADRTGDFVLAGRDSAVELLDGQTGKLLDRFRRQPGAPQVVGCDLFDDGSRAVVVEQGGKLSPPRLLVFDVRDGRLQLKNEAKLDVWDRQMAFLNRADLSPDERSVVVCRRDGTVRIYDLDGNATSAPLDHNVARGKAAYRATLSRDGARLLTAGDDGRVKYWARDAGGNWHDRVLMTFDALVKSAYFDREERRVVAGADDGVLRVVDLEGRVQHQFELRESAFQCVRFTDDGRHVVATVLDGRLLTWMLDLDELLKAARSLVIRDLTSEERAAYHELLGDLR